MLPRKGIPVWLETRYAAAHNKVLLIDAARPGAVVITGSYNFTWSAQARNAENLLILRGNPALARRYLDNWRRHRDDARSMTEAHEMNSPDFASVWHAVLSDLREPDLVWQLAALAACLLLAKLGERLLRARSRLPAVPGNSARAG
jgi:phosphatidylserine/phosphatidylglycerophosphate/cardiolipin synthase-like enzyme